MTKRDFFILLVKIFGLYSIIKTLFSVIPSSLSFIGMNNDLFTSFWIIFIIAVTVGLTVAFLFKSDKIVKLLKLERGFDEDRIDFGGLKPTDIIKLCTFIIGGFLVLDNIPNFLSHALFSFKSEMIGQEYMSKEYFRWAVSGVNILLGLLLVIKYDIFAKLYKSKESSKE